MLSFPDETNEKKSLSYYHFKLNSLLGKGTTKRKPLISFKTSETINLIAVFIQLMLVTTFNIL